MSKRFFVSILAVAFVMVVGFGGCSDDETAPVGGGSTSDTLAISLIDIAEVIRDVAPPEFTPPVTAPTADSFQVWTEGEFALLNKVFGTDDPQTLYRNLADFEMFMGIAESILKVDENGDIIEGTFTDTLTVTAEGQTMTMTPSAQVTALTSATVIPTAFQSLLGTSYSLEYLVSVEVPEKPDGALQIGLKISETEQTLLVYQANMGGEVGSTESSIVYASLNPTDSTFEFKGTMYSADALEVFSASYAMTSESTGDFTYRMSWFSDNIPESTLLGCIIGGGNKDTEFALKYRQYTPADAAEMDTIWSYDQVFGPNYTDGTGLITDYASYVNESLIIGYSLVPQVTLASPWVE